MPTNEPTEERHIRVRDLLAAADRRLADASSPEALKGNPYVGKPLPPGPNPYESNYWGHRMLKNAGFTLPWIQLDREITVLRASLPERAAVYSRWLEAELEALAQLRDERFASRRRWLCGRHERFVTELRESITELRDKVRRFNLEVPITDRQKRVPNADALYDEFKAIWSDAEARLARLTMPPEPPSQVREPTSPWGWLRRVWRH